MFWELHKVLELQNFTLEDVWMIQHDFWDDVDKTGVVLIFLTLVEFSDLQKVEN